MKRLLWIVAVMAVGAAAQSSASLLDQLPRVQANGYSTALQAAEARGPAGHADVLWIELFYGDSAAQAKAEAELRTPPPATAQAPEMAFLRFVSAYIQGQDRALLAAALRLSEAAPNDVATELAVRMLSGQLENQGNELLDAVPHLEKALEQPLADPATSYMLGRSLLAAVHAPGLALTPERAMQLSGRLQHWQEWGPFGPWVNLGFDRSFPIESSIAASYPADLATGATGADMRTAHAYENSGDGIGFPLDWGQRGVDFAVTYVHSARATRVLLRLYTPASAQLAINGTVVIRNDRRSSYTPATAVAELELAEGWNRIVVKLAGEAPRNFDLMLRPVAGGAAAGLEDAAALPAGAQPAGAPKLLPAPLNLASWSAARLARDPQDALALWVDGLRRIEDEDAEHGRVSLQQAAKADPNGTLIWLDLAEAYSQLQDASQSWAAAQIEAAANKAIAILPGAWRAYDSLGHVYESEGKPTQAAEAYAHCADKGYADCDWAQFHLAASQRWIPEAEAALGHALAESGSDWNSIGSGLEFYSSIGDAAKLAQWERVLTADPRAAGALGSFELRHGHAARAAALFRTAIAFQPSSWNLRRQYLEALLQSGALAEAATAAQTAVRAFPDNWRIAAEADEITLRQNTAAGVAALERTDYDRNNLRHEAGYLTGDKFWAPWYHSATDILKDAPGKSEYPNASSILVFDQMVNRINPDSSQDQYIHQIYRVLNSVGISQFGDVTTIPEGSDLITVRTIKQDGRMILPEKFANITSITMSGLEAGDYIEVEFVQHTPPSAIVPGTMDNSSFFIFNSNTQPYHYSDYICLSPPGYPLLTDEERFPAPPKVTTLADGYTAREWLVQKTRILISEPNMPPYQDLVPKVWVSSKLSWADIEQYIADHQFAVKKIIPEMDAEAATITAGKTTPVEKADAIFQWVAANIQLGDGGMWTPARQYFTDRNGSRIAVFLGLLSAEHVPYQMVLARSATDTSSTAVPSVFQFQYPLVHVGDSTGDSATGWYDLYGEFAQLGYISAQVRGGQAIAGETTPAAGDGLGQDFLTVPSFTSALDGIAVTVTGKVADSGDATLHFEMAFRGPAGEAVRQELSSLPDANLPQVYQQLLITNYPSGVASGGQILNRTDKSKPLIVAVDATVPGFIHTNSAAAGAGWDIDHLVGEVSMLRRYAPLAFRQEPLIIPGDSFEQTSVSLTLPAHFGAPTLPAAVNVKNDFGSFESSFTGSAGAGGYQLNFQRTLFLRADRIAPMEYPAFRSFGEAVDNQDRLQLTGTAH